MDTKITKVLYVVMMQEEITDIIKKYSFQQDTNFSNDNPGMLKGYTSTIKSTDNNSIQIHLVCPEFDPLHKKNCFGTEMAFLLAYLGIKNYSPDLVISFGYAGSNGLFPTKVGDICIADKSAIYHRNQMLIDFYKESSMGNYPVLSCPKLVEKLKYLSAQVGTSNDFILHDDVAVTMKIGVVEMELCSVARASLYSKTPCVGVKIVSDGGKIQTKEEREKEFMESLEFLRGKVVETFENVNNFLAGKSLSEL